MKWINVRGDEEKMYCAKLRDTIKARETFILRHGERALVEAYKMSKDSYELNYKQKN